MEKRPVAPGDGELLFEIYRQARQAEIDAFGWDGQALAAFARMQFELQQRSYAERYPGAEHSVVMSWGRAVGQLRVARVQGEIVLVDIALLERFRGRGLGAALIAALCAEASSQALPLRLSVRPENRARHLYERLGFREVSCHEACMTLVWRGRDALASALLERRGAEASAHPPGELARLRL